MITRKELDDELKKVSDANLNNAIKKSIIEDMIVSLESSDNSKGIEVNSSYLDVYDIDDMTNDLENYIEETISNYISDKYEIVNSKEPEL